jgi:hypothetical protein
MDIPKMLADLHAERQQIEEAIFTIERLAAGTRGKRRGRPPKWMTAASSQDAKLPPAPKTGRSFSPAARKRMAEAQKKRWAARKAAGEASTP